MTYWLCEQQQQLLGLLLLRLQGRGRARVSGCGSPVPGRPGGSLKVILETRLCFIFAAVRQSMRTAERERERGKAHHVLFVGKHPPSNFLSLTAFF